MSKTNPPLKSHLFTNQYRSTYVTDLVHQYIHFIVVGLKVVTMVPTEVVSIASAFPNTKNF